MVLDDQDRGSHVHAIQSLERTQFTLPMSQSATTGESLERAPVVVALDGLGMNAQ